MRRNLAARALLGTLGGVLFGLASIELATATVDRDLKARMAHMADRMQAAATRMLR